MLEIQSPALRGLSLLPQKLFRLDPCLFEDGPQRAFGHIAGVVGNGGVMVGRWVEPDLMGARRLAVELKSQLL